MTSNNDNNMIIVSTESLITVFSYIRSLCNNSNFEEIRDDIIKTCDRQIQIVKKHENDPMWFSY